MEDRILDQRGLGKQIKRVLPPSLFRGATIIFNFLVSRIPYGVKYPLGTYMRRRKYPYSIIREGDTVVQVGSANDTLHAGRCRTVYFARLVGGSGKVVVIEPDPRNCAELKTFAEKYGLRSRILLLECGAWRERAQLAFLSSVKHPASSVLADVKDIPKDLFKERDYQEVRIDVDTLDSLLEGAKVPTPRLVSITTNGAELPVLEGMKNLLSKGVRYISLASTGEGLCERMEKIGYKYIARDDRGYCFASAGPGSNRSNH